MGNYFVLCERAVSAGARIEQNQAIFGSTIQHTYFFWIQIRILKHTKIHGLLYGEEAAEEARDVER